MEFGKGGEFVCAVWVQLAELLTEQLKRQSDYREEMEICQAETEGYLLLIEEQQTQVIEPLCRHVEDMQRQQAEERGAFGQLERAYCHLLERFESSLVAFEELRGFARLFSDKALAYESRTEEERLRRDAEELRLRQERDELKRSLQEERRKLDDTQKDWKSSCQRLVEEKERMQQGLERELSNLRVELQERKTSYEDRHARQDQRMSELEKLAEEKEREVLALGEQLALQEMQHKRALDECTSRVAQERDSLVRDREMQHQAELEALRVRHSESMEMKIEELTAAREESLRRLRERLVQEWSEDQRRKEEIREKEAEEREREWNLKIQSLMETQTKLQGELESVRRACVDAEQSRLLEQDKSVQLQAQVSPRESRSAGVLRGDSEGPFLDDISRQT